MGRCGPDARHHPAPHRRVRGPRRHPPAVGRPAAGGPLGTLFCDTGRLEGWALRELLGVLARHTRTAPVWVAVWEGWGDLPDTVRGAPTFALPGRNHHLFRTSNLSEVEAFADACQPMEGHARGLALWWPDGREWCVATDIDADFTLVAGSRSLATDLIAQRPLETVEVSPDDDLAIAGDTLNLGL